MPENSKLNTTSDEQLIAAALQGDIDSFGAVVERYWNMAVALALSKVNDAVEAEDIAQDSFIKAYLQLHQLRDASRFAGWLSKIVAQQCINRIRKKARETRILSCETTVLEALNSAFAHDTNPGLTKQQTYSVRQAIGRLPERFQKLIIMRFIAGLSTPEIAKQLGKRNGTVRVWLYRAYQILRKELAPLLKEVE